MLFTTPSAEFLSSAKSIMASFTISGFKQVDPTPGYESVVIRHPLSRNGWQFAMNIPMTLQNGSFSVSFPSEIEGTLKEGERVSKLIVRAFSVNATGELTKKNALGCSSLFLGDYPGSSRGAM